MKALKKLCVYCGSSPGRQSVYTESAQALAAELVNNDIGLVYGGASIGIMGAIADAVLAGGGQVTGIIPRSIAEKEVAHSGLTELKVVESMHERKQAMADIADGFIALPGGLGTIEELFEMLTWAQLGFHTKPIALFNVAGYFDHLLSFLNHAVDEQFVKSEHHSLLLVEDSPGKIIKSMELYQASVVDKCIGRSES